nr:5884_t:CDS:2 [Entrophospora candida]
MNDMRAILERLYHSNQEKTILETNLNQQIQAKDEEIARLQQESEQSIANLCGELDQIKKQKDQELKTPQLQKQKTQLEQLITTLRSKVGANLERILELYLETYISMLKQKKEADIFYQGQLTAFSKILEEKLNQDDLQSLAKLRKEVWKLEVELTNFALKKEQYMVNKLEQILLGYQDKVGKMKVEEIRDFLADEELKPFIRGKKGRAVDTDELFYLSGSIEKGKIDLMTELLNSFIPRYSPHQPGGQDKFYPKITLENGLGFIQKNIFGEFANLYVSSQERRIEDSLKKLQERKVGTGETGENTTNQGNNNSSNQNNSNNNETNTPPFSTQKPVKERVQAAVNMANVALNGNSIEAIEKAREKLIEIQFNNSNKELQDEFNKNNGQELLNKLDEKERQIKNNEPEKKPDNSNKNNNIQQIQTNIITEITTLLNQNPKVSNNDLSTDYQN